jgi:hypothetical protein
MDIANLTTEELRSIKKQIEDELSKRHKANQDEKFVCWLCSDCFFDKDAHTSYPKGCRGGYRCMAWNKKGRIINTKHKAPAWCPKMKGDKNGVHEN